jgi:integrase
MIITALDTGMRRGEMLALRFADVDMARGLIVLRGETTKSKKTRLVPISTQRLRAVLEWLRIDAEGQQKPDEALVFSNEVGEPLPHLHDAWLRTVLKAQDQAAMDGSAEVQGSLERVEGGVPEHEPAVARPAARVRLPPG